MISKAENKEDDSILMYNPETYKFLGLDKKPH